MINIAIVDDNRVDLNEEVQITEEYFRKKGLLCRVEPFEDPDWMIRGIKEEQYDIYIMDIRMEKNAPGFSSCSFRVSLGW